MTISEFLIFAFIYICLSLSVSEAVNYELAIFFDAMCDSKVNNDCNV